MASQRLAPCCAVWAFSGIVSGTKAEAGTRNLRCLCKIPELCTIALLAWRLCAGRNRLKTQSLLSVGQAEGLQQGLPKGARCCRPMSLCPRPGATPLHVAAQQTMRDAMWERRSLVHGARRRLAQAAHVQQHMAAVLGAWTVHVLTSLP